MTLTDFIGNPCDFSFYSLPSKQEILRFVAFSRLRLKQGSKIPSNSDVFNDIAPQLVSFFRGKGFQTSTKSSVVR